MDFPKVNFNGKDYYIVGCKNCQASNWRVCTDGKDFIMCCVECKHIQEIKPIHIKTEPDKKPKKKFYDFKGIADFEGVSDDIN